MQKLVISLWLKRIVKVFLAIIVLISVLIFVPGVPNDIAMYGFAHNLYKYPLPDDWTREVNRHERIGLIVGKGNHCDFLVIRTLRTPPAAASKDKIKDYYRDVYLPAAYPEHGKVKVMISFHESVSPADGDLYYDLIIFDPGYYPGFDLRGH